MVNFNALSSVAQQIAELDAAKTPFNNSGGYTLGAMQQKQALNRQQGRSMMGGVPTQRPAPPQGGGMPPAGGGGGMPPPTMGARPPAPTGGGYRPQAPRTSQITPDNMMGGLTNAKAMQEYASANRPIRLASGNQRRRSGTERAMETEAAAREKMAAQAYAQKQQMAKMIYDQSINVLGMDHKQAQARADMAFSDPVTAREVMKDFMAKNNATTQHGRDVKETMRQEKATITREDEVTNRETADRVQALIAAGVDPKYVAAFGLEADEDSMVSVMEFLRKQKADDIESVEAKFALKKAERLALDDVNNAMRQTERSLDMVSDWSTGLAGWALEKVAGTDSTNLAGLLDTQKAYVAFRELMEMRQASKTGGALGNVSNREIELLYNSFASLNKDSDKEVIRTSLNDILMSTSALKFGLENEQKYQDMYTSGQMTMDEAYDAMDKAQSDYTNEYMANRTKVPQEAMDELYATKGNDQRAAANEFETEFGWRPRL